MTAEISDKKANDYVYKIVPAEIITNTLVSESKCRGEKKGKLLPADTKDVRKSLTAPDEGIMTFDPKAVPKELDKYKSYDSETILEQIAKNLDHWEHRI
jgi:hypothetical protein